MPRYKLATSETPWARSSVGQSRGLIIPRSQVRVLPGPLISQELTAFSTLTRRQMGTVLGTNEERALPSLSDLRDTLDEVFGDDALRDENRHTERMTLVCAVICDAFKRCEMRATVVGGGAVEFHAPGAYTTLDNDLVVEPVTMRPDRSALNAVFSALGFIKGPARHWVRDDFLVEVPSSHLEGPAEEHQVGPHTFRVVKKEVLLVE